MKIRQSEGDSNLYIFNDLDIAKEDMHLSDLNLIDQRTLGIGAGEGLWHFVNDVQKDPYAAALTAFSKLADKFIFRYKLIFKNYKFFKLLQVTSNFILTKNFIPYVIGIHTVCCTVYSTFTIRTSY